MNELLQKKQEHLTTSTNEAVIRSSTNVRVAFIENNPTASDQPESIFRTYCGINVLVAWSFMVY